MFYLIFATNDVYQGIQTAQWIQRNGLYLPEYRETYIDPIFENAIRPDIVRQVETVENLGSLQYDQEFRSQKHCLTELLIAAERSPEKWVWDQNCGLVLYQDNTPAIYAEYDYETHSLFLSGRSTHNANDCRTNRQCGLTPFDNIPNCCVHTGYYTRMRKELKVPLLDLAQHVISTKTRRFSKALRIFPQGYSYAGSTAFLTATTLQNKYPQLEYIIHIFNMPPIWNKEAGELMGKRFGYQNMIYYTPTTRLLKIPDIATQAGKFPLWRPKEFTPRVQYYYPQAGNPITLHNFSNCAKSLISPDFIKNSTRIVVKHL